MARTTQLAFALLGLIWGSNFIFMKMATAFITPVQVVFLRVLFGFVPIVLLALGQRALRLADLRHWPHFLAMSLLATALYYFAFAKGTSLLASSVAGMLSGAIPLFTFVTSYVFLRQEALTGQKLLGVVLGFLGVFLIAHPWTVGRNALNLSGVGYMTLGSVSLGCSFVYARRFMSKLDLSPLALSTYQIGIALIVLAAVTPWRGMSMILSSMPATVGLVLGLGFSGTGLAYVLYYYIVQRMGAVAASAVTYLPPIVALVIGHAIVGEPLEPLDLVALSSILLGVYAIQFPLQRTPVRS